MFLCRLYSVDGALVKLIGTNLHKLEELFLRGDLHMNDYSDVMKYLVIGCPKLRILHIDFNVTLEVVQYILLGLPNLIEFKHPLMVVALVNIIQDGRANRVSAIRSLYLSNFCNLGEKDIIKFVQIVLRHLNNITKLESFVEFYYSKESLPTFYVTLSKITQLTELTLMNSSNDNVHLLPALEAIGHQLKLLDCSCSNCPSLDVLDQCRELRVLRIAVLGLDASSMNDQSYGSDLDEEFTPFYHLQKLRLVSVTHTHLNSALLKSLIASPVLQELRLQSAPIVADHILKAVFNHVNEEGELLAFTSLHTLYVGDYYISNTDYFISSFTHERVPLEVLGVYKKEMISKIAKRNLEQFDIEIIETNNIDSDFFF